MRSQTGVTDLIYQRGCCRKIESAAAPFVCGRINPVYEAFRFLFHPLSTYNPIRIHTATSATSSVTAVPGIALAGENTVRMVSGDAVRYHLQTESGLYAVTIPLEAEARAGELVRGLQLMRVEI